MIRVGVSVEGRTEEEFIKSVLVPLLSCDGIFISPIDIGGNVSVDRSIRELSIIYNNFDYVTTFYDFYGFKGNTFNDRHELETALKDKLSEKLGHEARKFRPYIQMYEFEALLFSNPDCFQGVIQGCSHSDLAELHTAVSVAGNPEKINNSRNTAPSKRILKIWPHYDKVAHGPVIIKRIGVSEILNKCSGFREWYDWISNLRTQ